MIWQYFPIAFRFPVGDFSIETKRSCWRTALSALCACRPEGVTLYDAQQTYDVGTCGPVYLCIACFYGIKEARRSAKILYTLDALMMRLSIHQPFLQANALESFGPYPLLGTFRPDGRVEATEDGAALFETQNVEPMRRGEGMRLLIASEEGETEGSAQNRMQTLGVEAADAGFCVRRMQIANGGAGTVRALVTALNGRYETVSVIDAAGERQKTIIGILPGAIAVVEAFDHDAATVGALIRSALDLGFRRLRVAAGGCIDPENALCIAEALGVRFCNEADEPIRPDGESLRDVARMDRTGLDPRLASCECIALSVCNDSDDARIAEILHAEPRHDPVLCVLCAIGFYAESGAETVFRAIGFENAVGQADFVVLNPDRTDGETVRFALGELCAQKTPVCMIGPGNCDTDAWMREYPVLRGAVAVDAADADAQKRAFCAEVLPMVGKDVAKTSRI